MTAPTLLDFAESNYTDTSLTETTADVDWSGAGDVVLALGATEDNAQTIGTPSATGLTFAGLAGTPTNSASSCKCYAWSATAGADGNSVVTATGAGGTATRGISVWAFSGTGGLGTPVVSVSSTIVQSVTVAGPDSTVVMVLADWNATTDVAVTTVPAGGTVRRATNNAGAATFLIVEWTGQAAGTRDYGVSAWTGTGTVSKITIEVKGTGGSATDLVVQDAAHAQTADSPTLTQVHTLVVADAAHAQTADSPTLTQVHILAVQDAVHAQSADSPTLTQVHTLAVQDAVHAQSADSPTLTQVHTLAVQDAVQAQIVDNVVLAAGVTLTVADAAHAQTADSPTLTQVHILAVQDAVQAQTADSPTLTQVHTLAVQDAVHAQRADNVVLVVLDLLSRGSREVMIDGQARRILVESQAGRVSV